MFCFEYFWLQYAMAIVCFIPSVHFSDFFCVNYGLKYTVTGDIKV